MKSSPTAERITRAGSRHCPCPSAKQLRLCRSSLTIAGHTNSKFHLGKTQNSLCTQKQSTMEVQEEFCSHCQKKSQEKQEQHYTTKKSL